MACKISRCKKIPKLSFGERGVTTQGSRANNNWFPSSFCPSDITKNITLDVSNKVAAASRFKCLRYLTLR